MYNPDAARRMLAGHLATFYGDRCDLEAFRRNVLELAGFGESHDDPELRGMSHELLAQIEQGGAPALVLPALDVTVAPPALEADAGELIEAAAAAIEPTEPTEP